MIATLEYELSCRGSTPPLFFISTMDSSAGERERGGGVRAGLFQMCYYLQKHYNYEYAIFLGGNVRE